MTTESVHTNPDGTQVTVTLGNGVTLGKYVKLGDYDRTVHRTGALSDD